MNICFSVDNNYVKYLLITAHSILQEGAKNPDHPVYNFFVIADGLSDQNQKLLKNFELQENKICKCKFTYIQASEDLFKRGKTYGENLNYATYLRLLIPDLLPNLKGNVLYLDVDLICQDDLAELINMDLGDNILAASPDPGVAVFSKKITFTPRKLNKLPLTLKYKRNEFYINAGVLLINLDNWRKNDVTKKCLHYLQNYKVNLCDQDLLNIVCKGRISFLNPTWNFMTSLTMDKVVRFYEKHKNVDVINPCADFVKIDDFQNIKIIHYATKPKPWNLVACEDGVIITLQDKLVDIWYSVLKTTPLIESQNINPRIWFSEEGKVILRAIDNLGVWTNIRYNKSQRRWKKTKMFFAVLLILNIIALLL